MDSQLISSNSERRGGTPGVSGDMWGGEKVRSWRWICKRSAMSEGGRRGFSGDRRGPTTSAALGADGSLGSAAEFCYRQRR